MLSAFSNYHFCIHDCGAFANCVSSKEGHGFRSHLYITAFIILLHFVRIPEECVMVGCVGDLCNWCDFIG